MTEAIELVYSSSVLARSISLVLSASTQIAAIAMASEIANPIDQSPEGLVHTLVVDPPQRGMGRGRLLLHEIEGRAQQRWTWIRAQVPYGDISCSRLFSRASGWDRVGITVRKVLARGGDAYAARYGTDPPTIRLAREADLPFVHALLTEACLIALGPAEESRFTPDQVRRSIEGILSPIVNPGLLVLVAEERQGLVGHATADLDSYEEMTGRVGAHLHDTFVVAEARGRGIARQLTAAVEERATACGCSFITGTVGCPGGEEPLALLRALAQDGWKPDVTTMRKQLIQTP